MSVSTLKTKKKKITIKAVGDICPGDISIFGLGVCSLTKRMGVGFPFKYIAKEFAETDIVIGNLEGMLSKKVNRVSVPDLPFCGLPEFAKELKNTGFNVINIANNHVLDNGVDIFLETVELLEAEGIKICGIRGKENFYSEPAIVTVNEKKIGILSYNWIAKDKFPFVDQYIAQSRDSVVNYTWNRNISDDEKNQIAYADKNENVINDIKLLKQKVDIVILIPHWAFEFIHYPPYGVTLEARAFIDAGVDLIIGTHPHVIQGYEKYNEKNIFYSLGNFIFDSRRKITKNSVILLADISNNNDINCSLKYVKLNESFQPTHTDFETGNIIKESNKMISSPEKKELLNDDKLYREFEKQYNKGKYQTIINHFQVIFIYPAVIKVIVKKIYSFLEILKLRFQGKKVRW